MGVRLVGLEGLGLHVYGVLSARLGQWASHINSIIVFGMLT